MVGFLFMRSATVWGIMVNEADVWTVILKYNFNESASVGYTIFDKFRNRWSNDKAYSMVFNYSIRGLRIRTESEQIFVSTACQLFDFF